MHLLTFLKIARTTLPKNSEPRKRMDAGLTAIKVSVLAITGVALGATFIHGTLYGSHSPDGLKWRAAVVAVIVGCLIAGVINGVRAFAQSRRRYLAHETELEAEWRAQPVRRSAVSPVVLVAPVSHGARLQRSRPLRASAPGGASPDKLQKAPLSPTELRAELPGNTFGSGGLRVFIALDGCQYVAVGTRVDLGRWRITPAGPYFRTWNVTDGGRERCYHVYRDGETFDFHVNDRWTVLRWTRTHGRAADF